jgi:hypothetical protein
MPPASLGATPKDEGTPWNHVLRMPTTRTATQRMELLHLGASACPGAFNALDLLVALVAYRGGKWGYRKPLGGSIKGIACPGAFRV